VPGPRGARSLFGRVPNSDAPGPSISDGRARASRIGGRSRRCRMQYPCGLAAAAPRHRGQVRGAVVPLLVFSRLPSVFLCLLRASWNSWMQASLRLLVGASQVSEGESDAKREWVSGLAGASRGAHASILGLG